MLPVLIKFGPVSIPSFGLCLALAFIVSIFIIWRSIKDHGVDESQMFDQAIVISILALFGARFLFVVTHWQLFAPQVLRILVIWRIPGLSYIGAIIFAIVVFILYSFRQKLILLILFDAYAKALPAIIFFVSLGTWLDGSVVGKTTTWVTGMPGVGVAGLRHPIGLYGMVLAIVMELILFLIIQWKKKHGVLLEGVLGWIAVSLFGLIQLLLAFFRDDLLYFESVSIEEALAVVLLITPWLPLFVLLDGKTKLVKTQEYLLAVSQKFLKKFKTG